MMQPNEDNLKLQFARLLLKNSKEPLQAALPLYPDNEDTHLALQAAKDWPSDPIVLQEQQRIISEEGDESLLPTKADVMTDLWEKMHPPNGYIPPEDYAKLMKLYLEARDFMPRKGANVQINNNTNRVMVYENHGSDDNWQKDLLEQQEILTHVSSD